jgi:hypothetical protein
MENSQAYHIPAFSIIIPILVTLGMSIFQQLPWSALFLFLHPFKIHLYRLTDREICTRIQKKLSYSTHKTDDNKHYGYALGKWYAIALFREFGDWNVTLISTETTYKALISPVQYTEPERELNYVSLQEEGASSITLLQRYGPYVNFYYKKRVVDLGILEPFPQQQSILETIQSNQEKFGYSVIFLHGPPGSGKSMIAYILAQRARGTFCTTLKLWEPGSSLEDVYEEAAPTKKNPLILLFDEIDILIKSIHEQTIEQHKKYPIAMYDKSGWNRFFDSIQLGLYPNLILIMTSNKSTEEINKLDPCYLRAHRVDFCFHLKDTIQE